MVLKTTLWVSRGVKSRSTLIIQLVRFVVVSRGYSLRVGGAVVQNDWVGRAGVGNPHFATLDTP